MSRTKEEALVLAGRLNALHLKTVEHIGDEWFFTFDDGVVGAISDSALCQLDDTLFDFLETLHQVTVDDILATILRSCPMCGGNASMESADSGGIPLYRVSCDDCGVGTSLKEQHVAVMAWNLRPYPVPRRNVQFPKRPPKLALVPSDDPSTCL